MLVSKLLHLSMLKLHILLLSYLYNGLMSFLANVSLYVLYLERKMSLIYSPINVVMFYGVLLETIIFIFIVYIPGVNNWFGARPVDILNLGYFRIL